MPAGSVEVQSEARAARPAAFEQPSKADDALQTRLPSRSAPAESPNRPTFQRRGNSTITVISSLAVVVGIFLVVVWISRRAAPQSTQALPSDVVQVLGRAPLAARNVMHLVRVGNKLVLISLTAHGATTLTEITEPQEVDRLLAQCERSRPGSISATFRHVLHQFAEDRSARGFLGREQEGERQAS